MLKKQKKTPLKTYFIRCVAIFIKSTLFLYYQDKKKHVIFGYDFNGFHDFFNSKKRTDQKLKFMTIFP